MQDSENSMLWTVFGAIIVAVSAGGASTFAIAPGRIERSMLDLLNTLLMLLQGSTLGVTVRSAQYLYPVLEAIHILGIALLVGPAFTFDLRLLG
ncbi:MAG TPA: hypothetical protein VES20_18070, partial [Bryobacteraceae bacterium]|nr:hypothetical protein [Bryobacteraceae bacterium]